MQHAHRPIGPSSFLQCTGRTNAFKFNCAYNCGCSFAARIAAAAAASQQTLVYSLCSAEQHDKPGHPETISRISAIDQALSEHGFLNHPQVLYAAHDAVDAVSVVQAIELVHPPGYLQRVQEICSCLHEPAMVDESTYLTPGSYAACCKAAAAVLSVLHAVLAGSTGALSPAGFCLVRPPGHHVLPSRPMGFGLINFMAVAARYAQHQHTVPVHKVMIVDFDVHHGNGTEEIMYSDASVLYISTHQQGLWPYTGKLQQTGSGDGKGSTINIPLPGGTGHTAMAAVLQQIIRPAAHRFQPDLILVSAGYDSHYMDPLAGFQFTSQTYHMLCSAIVGLAKELCGGRCMFILEGGYHQQSLAEAVVESFAGILGMPVLSSSATQLYEEPLNKVEDVLRQVKQTHTLRPAVT